MMDYYAELDAGGQVLSVLGHEGDPLPGHQLLTSWTGWPAAPGPHVTLHYIGGALTWQDPRTLAQAQADQIVALTASYVAAIASSVVYNGRTYQADPQSQNNVAQMQLAFAGSAATPAGFYWVAADNTQVPFTYADIQGLAAAMGAQGFTAFARLQTRKAAVLAAATVPAVTAIVW